MTAKPTYETVGPELLQEYLNSASDFAFELQVKRILVAEKLAHEHGGSYIDAITDKVRQFDLRAWVPSRTNIDCDLALNLAIECKNLREFNPLLVHCVPRAEHESFHSISWNSGSEAGDLSCVKMDSRYKVDEASGKSWAQVSKSTQPTARVQGSDSEIYEKWSQALASASDLLTIPSGRPSGGYRYCVVLPLVVVPDAMLWMVNYDGNGEQLGECEQIESISYFVNYDYSVPFGDGLVKYTASHIENFTIGGFAKFVASLSKTAVYRAFFPDHVIYSVLPQRVDARDQR